MKELSRLIPNPEWHKFTQNQLAYGCVHIWMASVIDQIPLLSETDIPPDEWKSGMSFRSEADRYRYLIARKMRRQVLSLYLGIEPMDLCFRKGFNGKPNLVNLELHFNMAHSGERVALAISKSDIGIDVEHINRIFNFEDLIQACYNANEMEFIDQSDSRTEAFFTLWTRKEAMLKRSGEGISVNLPDINCLRDHGTYSWKEMNYCIAVSVNIKEPDFYFYNF